MRRVPGKELYGTQVTLNKTYRAKFKEYYVVRSIILTYPHMNEYYKLNRSPYAPI